MRPLTVRGVISFAIVAAVTHALPGIMLVKRDLPVEHGCDPCPGGDASYYNITQQYYAQIDPQYLQDGQDSFGQSFPIGYVPPLCGVYGVNCVTAGPGVTWTGDEHPQGLSAPIGRWQIVGVDDNGQSYLAQEILAWVYWQSTLQWTCPGGSGTVYLAHCQAFTCAKGTMQAEVSPGGTVKGDGERDDGAGNNCKCFPQHFPDERVDPYAVQVYFTCPDGNN